MSVSSTVVLGHFDRFCRAFPRASVARHCVFYFAMFLSRTLAPADVAAIITRAGSPL